jgi:hypothetical protein
MTRGWLKTWLALSADNARLALEAQQVIGLRMMKLAAGGAAAQAEMTRMFTEKAFAGGEAAATLAFGGSARKVVRGYRTRVKANRRRLSRRKRK